MSEATRAMDMEREKHYFRKEDSVSLRCKLICKHWESV